jgi:hypothetical protein
LTKIVNQGVNDVLPDVLDIPLGEIEKYWGHWAMWRATGRRVDFSNALTEFPHRMWDVVFLLDGLYQKLETAKAKKDAQSKTHGRPA